MDEDAVKVRVVLWFQCLLRTGYLVKIPAAQFSRSEDSISSHDRQRDIL
jgi:hypothetical protein